MHVGIYNRTTVNGKRQYRQADKKSTGPFWLRYTRHGRRDYHPCFRSFTYREALAQAREMEAKLLREDDEPIDDPKPSPDRPLTLEQQRDAFLRDKNTTYKKDGSPLDPDTIRGYENVTREFLDTVKRKHADKITKQDLKDWIAGQRKKVSHRTVCNLYISVVCFLHFCGVDHKKLMPQSERPTPIEETPEAYTQTEMTKFFFACVDEKDNLFFDFLLKTGAREREATCLEWTDLSLGSSPTVKFQTKEGFRTKTGKSRVVPLERGLAEKLAAWHEKNPVTRLVFGREGDKVEGHYLRKCKAVATAAGQNEERFWLHKFRDTFATWALRRGVDIRTVSGWLGHANIEMTMRYLAPAEAELAQAGINRAFGETLAVTANV